MNIIDAAHKTVQAYPGGSETLALRIDMSAAVLRNKVNPNNTTHHLSLEEASEVMGVTGDHRMLHALAATHGYVLRKVDAPDAGSMLASFLYTAALEGKLSALLADAMRDGRISLNEAKAISELCSDGQAFLAQTAQHAYAAAKSGTPA